MKPIKIKIFYEGSVNKITGKNSEDPVVSEGLSFIQFLNFIFSSYPEIQQKFPPGKLGLLLNEESPVDSDILSNGDEVKLIGVK